MISAASSYSYNPSYKISGIFSTTSSAILHDFFKRLISFSSFISLVLSIELVTSKKFAFGKFFLIFKKLLRVIPLKLIPIFLFVVLCIVNEFWVMATTVTIVTMFAYWGVAMHIMKKY